MKKFIIIFALIIAASGLTGCGKYFQQVVEEQPAESLAVTAMEYYETGKYKNAIKHFQKINDWYPFSKYAILAELKIADSHFKLKSYEEASYSYKSFERLHPKNEAIPYVIYQTAMCDYNRIDTIDRDQGSTLRALAIFDRLNAQFPNNEYAEDVKEKIITCNESITGNYFYIGSFYFKQKSYAAALNRFKMITDNYPETDVYPEAIEYIALCETKIREEVVKEGIMKPL